MAKSKRLHRGITKYIGAIIHPIWRYLLEKPIFIVGSPRSGTSILGDVLSQNQNWIYLYEPRYIWRYKRPDLNIWGPGANGKLFLDENYIQARDKLISHWFHFSKTIAFKNRLVEKMPLHVFRIKWLHTLFPDAKFIHLIRHGRDVAFSLEKAIKNWHGFRESEDPIDVWQKSWNYRMFEAYAMAHEDLHEILTFIHTQPTSYTQSLLVWQCCVHAGLQARHSPHREHILQVRYEDFVSQPNLTLKNIFAFLDESLPNQVIDYAQNHLHMKSIRKPDLFFDITDNISGKILRELGYTKND